MLSATPFSAHEPGTKSASTRVANPVKPPTLFTEEGIANHHDGSTPATVGKSKKKPSGFFRLACRASSQDDPCGKLKNTVEATVTRPTVAQICEHYGSRIYNLARWMAFNRCDAEDITQDVFLQLVRKLATFRGESEFTTWLHRVTVNAALGHRRRFGVRRTLAAVGPLEHFLDRGRHWWSLQPDHQAQTRELQRKIDQAIARLPKIYRQVFVLADVNNLPLADVADLLMVKLGAIKSRLHRARRLLRTYLAPYLED
jgi:RNA polymerase sigma-70 factor (ECF subfamily)